MTTLPLCSSDIPPVIPPVNILRIPVPIQKPCWFDDYVEKDMVELIALGIRHGVHHVPWLLGTHSRLVSFVEFHKCTCRSRLSIHKNSNRKYNINN